MTINAHTDGRIDYPLARPRHQKYITPLGEDPLPLHVRYMQHAVPRRTATHNDRQ